MLRAAVRSRGSQHLVCPYIPRETGKHRPKIATDRSAVLRARELARCSIRPVSQVPKGQGEKAKHNNLSCYSTKQQRPSQAACYPQASLLQVVPLPLEMPPPRLPCPAPAGCSSASAHLGGIPACYKSQPSGIPVLRNLRLIYFEERSLEFRHHL